MSDQKTQSWRMGIRLSDAEAKIQMKFRDAKTAFEDDDRRFVEAIDSLIDKMPSPRSAREQSIFNAAYQIGYIDAMQERELWWTMYQVVEVQKRSAEKRLTKSGEPKTSRDAKLRLRYLKLREDLDDLPARQQLCDDFRIGLSYLTDLLRKTGVLPGTQT